MVDASILRVGICYDGAYYQRVSDYYLRHHPSQSRLSFTGFHDFLRAEVAVRFDADVQRTRVVEAHYYRGRLPTRLATERDLVVSERAWDESLGFAGIVPHYFPLSVGPGDKLGEKGVDVALALDAYDLALRRQVDVLVLIASDGDFVPLLRRLHGTGTAVLLPVWDLMYTDDRGIERQLRAAGRLRAEAMWTIDVPSRLEQLATDDPSRLSALFVPRREPLVEEMTSILARVDAERIVEPPPPELVDVDLPRAAPVRPAQSPFKPRPRTVLGSDGAYLPAGVMMPAIRCKSLRSLVAHSRRGFGVVVTCVITSAGTIAAQTPVRMTMAWPENVTVEARTTTTVIQRNGASADSSQSASNNQFRVRPHAEGLLVEMDEASPSEPLLLIGHLVDREWIEGRTQTDTIVMSDAAVPGMAVSQLRRQTFRGVADCPAGSGATTCWRFDIHEEIDTTALRRYVRNNAQAMGLNEGQAMSMPLPNNSSFTTHIVDAATARPLRQESSSGFVTPMDGGDHTFLSRHVTTYAWRPM